MTVVLDTRDDFTLANFRRVCYGGEAERRALAEEARAAAMPTLLPAAVNDPQDDVSSPAFGAYRREATAAECLDGAIALLAGEAGRALDAAGRRPAPPVKDPLPRVRAARKGPDPA